MSRRVHDVYAEAVSSYISYLKERILEALGSDEFYLQEKEKLQQDNVQEKYKY